MPISSNAAELADVLPEEIERVVVLGLGKVTGAAVVNALIEAEVEIRVTEESPTNEHLDLAKRLRTLGVEVDFGAPDPGLLDWADLIVPSPGVPPSNPLLRVATDRGIRIWSELELGVRYLDRNPLVAITGTNGKTTTTTLLASILETGGFPAVAAGNIGLPLVEASRSAPAGWVVVCEASSAQLHYIDTFQPDIAIVMNFSDDHLDWHKNREDYLLSKARITENQTANDLLLFRIDDIGCQQIAMDSKAALGAFGLDTPDHVRARAEHGVGRSIGLAAGVADGNVVIGSDIRENVLLPLTDIRLVGSHNVENVLAACLAAVSHGVDVEAIGHAVSRFESLPHRAVLVAEKGGVRYVDDSKATNPHATLRALSGLSDVVLIAGGRAKGLDLSILSEASGRLKGVVGMGEAMQDLHDIFSGLPWAAAQDVEQAVELASHMAQTGDTVLLSPACSSLDQYSSYSERGERFAAAVAKI